MALVYLDDERNPFDDNFIKEKSAKGVPVVICRSFDSFQKTITELNTEVSLVSFDHDLGASYVGVPVDDQPNGVSCVRWLIEFCKANNMAFPEYRLHTANGEGYKNMLSWINSALKIGYIKIQVN